MSTYNIQINVPTPQATQSMPNIGSDMMGAMKELQQARQHMNRAMHAMMGMGPAAGLRGMLGPELMGAIPRMPMLPGMMAQGGLQQMQAQNQMPFSPFGGGMFGQGMRPFGGATGQQVSDVCNKVGDTLQGIGDVAGKVSKFLPGPARLIGAAVTAGADIAGGVAKGVGKLAKGDVLGAIGDVAGGIGKAVGDVFGGIGKAVGGFFSKIFGGK